MRPPARPPTLPPAPPSRLPCSLDLDGRLVQVANVGGRLARLLVHHDGLRADEPERIDHDFSLDRLDRVNHDGHRALVQRFKALCGEKARARTHTHTTDSQQPKPGWEWYHPTTISGLATHASAAACLD